MADQPKERAVTTKLSAPRPDQGPGKKPENSPIEKRVKSLYGVMQSIEGQIGGGEGVEGLYGSIKLGGMKHILAAMTAECNFGADSCLVDIGAGLGRPLMHAMVAHGIGLTFGVEIDAIKCQKAEAFLRHTHTILCKRGVVHADMALPPITCAAIEQVTTLEPATHAYSFWEGVPIEGRMAFGRLFAGSSTLQAVAVVQRAVRGEKPAEMMLQLGFGDLLLTDSFPVSMSGSGRSFRAYVFNRVSPQQQGKTIKSKVESDCHCSPATLKSKAGMTHAALIDLQLQRIHVSTRPSDTAPQLSAVKGAGMISDNARSARRAARSSSTSLATLKSDAAAVQGTADSHPVARTTGDSTAHRPAAPCGVSPSRASRASIAASRSASDLGRSAATKPLQSTTNTSHVEVAIEVTSPELLTVRCTLVESPKKRGTSGSRALKQRSSPIKSSPLKSNGSSLKLVKGSKGTAQRELWGRNRKASARMPAV